MLETQSKPLTYEHDFAEYLTRREAGEIVEIDEEMFYYWLEVLPPVGFNGEQHGESMRMNGMGGQWTRKDGSLQRFAFAFAEGYERITVFWTDKETLKNYAQLTGILNRC